MLMFNFQTCTGFSFLVNNFSFQGIGLDIDIKFACDFKSMGALQELQCLEEVLKV